MTAKGAPGHIYGPVPSRRLGRSLGIDLVPYKACSYDCVYCQLGRTTSHTSRRRSYVDPAEVLTELKGRLSAGPAPDYISLAGSGEPTLCRGLEELIPGIKALTRIPVAVITNGSLLSRPPVAEALLSADLVVPSLDAGDEKTFRQINRPCRGIDFGEMARGLVEFGQTFRGRLDLEVFLVAGLNDSAAQVKRIARLAERIAPRRVQLNTVARPPAEAWAGAVPRGRLMELAKLFAVKTEIISPRTPATWAAASSGPAAAGRVAATIARRPCTADDVARGLGLHRLEALKSLERLVAAGRAAREVTGKKIFYRAARGRQRTPKGEG